jgi:hypothetical protein
MQKIEVSGASEATVFEASISETFNNSYRAFGNCGYSPRYK